MNNIKNNESSKVEKIGTLYLEVGFFNRSEIKELEDYFHEAGPYLYLKILERLTAEGGRIRIQYLDLLLKKSTLKDRQQEYIALLLELGLISKEKGYYRSERVDYDLDRVKKQRDQWRSRQAKYRKSLDPVTRDSLGDSEGVTLNMNMNMNKNMNKNMNMNIEHEPGTDQNPTKNGRKPIGKKKRIWLSDSELKSLRLELTDPILEQCLKKFSDWIESDPVPGKVRAGEENAVKNILGWVLDSISKESNDLPLNGIGDLVKSIT